jgi:hypothetical protein
MCHDVHAAASDHCPRCARSVASCSQKTSSVHCHLAIHHSFLMLQRHHMSAPARRLLATAKAVAVSTGGLATSDSAAAGKNSVSSSQAISSGNGTALSSGIANGAFTVANSSASATGQQCKLLHTSLACLLGCCRTRRHGKVIHTHWGPIDLLLTHCLYPLQATRLRCLSYRPAATTTPGSALCLAPLSTM